MAVTIRLQRAGARNRPFYRVVVADSRKPRDGAFIEKVGYYDPLPDPDVISLEMQRVRDWLQKGAQPSDAVRSLIRRFERRPAGKLSEQTASAAMEVSAPTPGDAPSSPSPEPTPKESAGPEAVSEESAAAEPAAREE